MELVDISMIDRQDHNYCTDIEQPADKVCRIQQILPALLVELQAFTEHVEHNVHHNGRGAHVHDRSANQLTSILEIQSTRLEEKLKC